MYGPEFTFLGVPWPIWTTRRRWRGRTWSSSAPPTAAPATGRGPAWPSAIRGADYLGHDGTRPSLALGWIALRDLRVVDAGDVLMLAGEIEPALARLERAVHTVAAAGAIPVVLGGDPTIALPDVTGVARQHGMGRVSVVHFDAHADTSDTQFGPARPRHPDAAADRVGRGPRRPVPPARPARLLAAPDVLAWMADQGMRSFEMTEIVRRGLDACLSEAFAIATDDCDGVFLSVDIDVVDPGMAPGTGTPEPGGLTARSCWTRSALRARAAGGRHGRGRAVPGLRRARPGDRVPGQPGGAGGAVGADGRTGLRPGSGQAEGNSSGPGRVKPVMETQPELPARLARDLDGAFEELVGVHQRLVYGLALRVVGVPADAEEVAQDTFERAYHALAGYPAERVAAMRLRPWLATIALNLARNRLRRRPPPARPLEDGDGRPRPWPPAAAEPAEVAERGQERERWAELLAALPRGYREAVVLRHVEGLPYAEVAEILGRPVGTVKTHVHRGVRQLRQELEARKERTR